MNYSDKLAEAVRQCGAPLCLGLDPVYETLPEPLKSVHSDPVEALEAFCGKLIELTAPYVSAYKLNTAYYEAWGSAGFELLETITRRIPEHIVTIADTKRGDVPHTALKYKEAFFDRLNFDAITLSPLMGKDTLRPFLEDYRKACYILTLTSNDGASDFFMQRLQNGRFLCEEIADQLHRLSGEVQGQVGMVVGATHSRDADAVCKAFPQSHLLTPGIGAQQGNPDELIGVINRYHCKALIPVSRGIIEAHKNSSQSWTEAVVTATKNFNRDLQEPARWHVTT